MATFPNIEKPSGMTERTVKGQYKTEFEAGYVQSRAKWTRSRKIFALSWTAMEDADKVLLEVFFDNNLGATFNWTHPVSSTTYTVRFVEDELPAQYVPVNHWQIDLTLEEQ